MKRMSVSENDYKNINLIKVFITIILIVGIIFLIYSVFLKKDKTEKNIDNISIVNEEKNENKSKSIEDILLDFGGKITEKVREDTYYIQKEGIDYTVYLDGDIIEGKVPIWDGTSIEPAIDEAGNYNIYKPQELKWIADKVISGEKNFGGVTITLRNNIDFGARLNENNEWDGNTWTSIIGFLDEIDSEKNNNENINNTSSDSINTNKTNVSSTTNNDNNNNNNNSNSNIDNNNNQENDILDSTSEITRENLKRFAGIFNGNNLWIKGLFINSDKRYQGLFGYQTGTIQNLTIKNSKIQGGEGTGAIVGLNGGTIVNCHIENIDINGINNKKIGGISGISMTGSWIENCSILNCKINGENYVGGITGYMNNNSAIISSTNSSSQVTGKDYIGGIAGISFYGTQIKSCSNMSLNICGINYVGGLVGYSESNIENSYNNGKNNFDGSISGNNYIGGLVGLNYVMGTISNSFNYSEIKCSSKTECKNIGGIVGLNNATISNCYNSAKIIIENSSAEKVGGICGQNLSESFIYNSYNIGKIECNNASGDVGANFGEISNCFYLNSTVSQSDNNSRDENQMKNDILESLGEEFKKDTENINNGFPILKWQ